MNLPRPSTQLQEVLMELIENDHITVRQILSDTGILNPKARLHNLRRMGLEIDGSMIKTKNKYGRICRYGSWTLIDKQKGKELYLKLVKTPE